MRLLHVLVDGLLVDTLLLFPALIFLGLVLAKKPPKQAAESALEIAIGWIALLIGLWAIGDSLGAFDGLLSELSLAPKGARRANLDPVLSFKGDYKHTQAFAVLVAIAVNVVWARLTRARYLFLNPIQVLLSTGLVVVIFARADTPSWVAVLLTGAAVGSGMAWLPWVAGRLQPVKPPEDPVGLGTMHTGLLLGVAWLAGKLGASETPKKGKAKPEQLFANPITFGSVVVGALCLLLAVNAGEDRTGAVLSKSAVLGSLPSAGAGYYLVGAAIVGLIFGAGLWVTLQAIPMITDPLTRSFEGLRRILPETKPALDALFMFPENPRAGVAGFLLSTAGGALGSYLFGVIGLVAVIPGMLVSLTAGHLFLGGAAGIVADRAGGTRAMLILAPAHGLVLSLLVSLCFTATGPGRATPVGVELADLSALGALLGAVMRLFQ